MYSSPVDSILLVVFRIIKDFTLLQIQRSKYSRGPGNQRINLWVQILQGFIRYFYVKQRVEVSRTGRDFNGLVLTLDLLDQGSRHGTWSCDMEDRFRVREGVPSTVEEMRSGLRSISLEQWLVVEDISSKNSHKLLRFLTLSYVFWWQDFT